MKYQVSLDKARIARGLTLRQLASQAGISYSAISNLVNGRSRPHPRTAHLLAGALGCKPTDIFPESEVSR